MQADKIVREKFETHRRGMELLSKGPADMQDAVPSAGPGGNSIQNSSSVRQLRKLMEDVSNECIGFAIHLFSTSRKYIQDFS